MISLEKGWSIRSSKDLNKIFTNYIVYKEKGIIKGGFSLSDLGNGQKLLECIFSDESGIGTVMMNKYIKKQGIIYAYSKEHIYFTKNGFKKLDKKSDTGASLYIYN